MNSVQESRQAWKLKETNNKEKLIKAYKTIATESNLALLTFLNLV